MPKPMTPDEVLRQLRVLRFGGKKGRHVTFRWLARQTGYDHGSLYRAVIRGWVAPAMAKRLSVALQEGHNAFLGRIGGGFDGRGYRGPAPKPAKPTPSPRKGPVGGPVIAQRRPPVR